MKTRRKHGEKHGFPVGFAIQEEMVEAPHQRQKFSFCDRVPEFSFWFPKQVEEELCFTNSLQFRSSYGSYHWSARTSSLKVGLQSLKLWCPRCPYSTQAAWKPYNTTCFVSTLYISLSDCTLIRACSFTCHSWRSMCRNPRIQFLSISASSSENGFCLKPFVPGCTW